jgi:hypothetical protein
MTDRDREQTDKQAVTIQPHSVKHEHNTEEKNDG